MAKRQGRAPQVAAPGSARRRRRRLLADRRTGVRSGLAASMESISTTSSGIGRRWRGRGLMAEGIEVRTGRDGSKSYRASIWDSARGGRVARPSQPTMGGGPRVAPRRDCGAHKRPSAAARRPGTDVERRRAGMARRRQSRGRCATAPGNWTSGARSERTSRTCGSGCCPSSGIAGSAKSSASTCSGSSTALRCRHSSSTVMTSLLPLRAVYRRAMAPGKRTRTRPVGLSCPPSGVTCGTSVTGAG
jgi:hypothetical protein